mmetsp:Transcript_32772/g.33123  ORF Transcript_32772/g.33123 Transcript_32772/m.33123 type:complete len:151 (+) Transcript_32772:2-454(+)
MNLIDNATMFKEFNKAHQLFLRYAQTHPKSLAMALCGSTTLVGIVLFKIIDDGHDDYDYNKRNTKQKMTIEEARLIAMLENAKESSWQENVENAVDAQEHFVLPGRQRNVPKFMDKIDQRSFEILQNHHNKIDDERNIKIREEKATHFWK